MSDLGEDTQPDLAAVGSDIIQKSANSPWIDKILAKEESSDVLSVYPPLSGNSDQTERLKIWFAHKLKGEQQRHIAGHHMEDDDQVFNETDRIVAAVLDLRFDFAAASG